MTVYIKYYITVKCYDGIWVIYKCSVMVLKCYITVEIDVMLAVT